MSEILEKQVGDMARTNYAFLSLFNELNMDFFCKRNQSIKEAIDEAGINEKLFLDKFNQLEMQGKIGYPVNVDEWPLDLMADYIQKTHHVYTEQALTNLKGMLVEPSEMEHISIDFAVEFDDFSKKMGAHMKKEELMLFPAIRKLTAKNQTPPKGPALQRFVDNMVHEHDEQFESLKKIRKMLENYQLPNLSKQENEIMLLMKEIDGDLAHHLHLENNILFPKSLELVQLKD